MRVAGGSLVSRGELSVGELSAMSLYALCTCVSLLRLVKGRQLNLRLHRCG